MRSLQEKEGDVNKSRQWGRPLKDREEVESGDLKLIICEIVNRTVRPENICWNLREHGLFNTLNKEREFPNFSRIDFFCHQVCSNMLQLPFKMNKVFHTM